MRSSGNGGERDDQVAELVVRLEPAAGADAEQLLDAELDQLLEDDRRAGAAHARALHGDALALVCAGVAQQAALGVLLLGVVEVRLGDVLGPQRVAGEEAGLGVLARLGSNVDRHGGDPNPCDRSGGRATIRAVRKAIEPRLSQILEFCAEDPVERVFLEDVARRRLGRFTGVRGERAARPRSATWARSRPRG